MSVTRSVLALAALAIVLAACTSQPADPAGGSAVPTTTAAVVRTDIAYHQQLNGTLTYADAYTLVNQAGPGVYTSVPSPGAVFTRGEVIYRVDNRPVSLFYGDPEWRSLSVGVTDGPDVEQVEENLLALGFANSANLIANGHFDGFDAAAIRRWQHALGLSQTGVLNLGDVIFEPGPIRVAVVHAGDGMPAQAGQPVIDATSTRHVVSVSLDVGLEPRVKTGDSAVVTLPSGAAANGVIASIGSVASAPAPQGGGSGPATVPLTITLSDPAAGGGLDQAPVVVSVTDTVHRAVLAVPVTALLAEPGGNFAVEVVDGSPRHLVAVTTGLFDDRGLVEVTSPELHEGMLVEVPQS